MISSIVEKLAVAAATGIVVGLGALKLRENLPGDPSPDNIRGLEDLDFVERTTLKLAFAAGLVRSEVQDFGLVKTATVKTNTMCSIPDQTVQLIAFPFTGWLGMPAAKPVVIES
jgi:hypothetical protein